MSMKYIRDYYKVPAKRGGRIRWHKSRASIDGTIVGSKGQHLRVRFDDNQRIYTMHPTWDVEYL